MPDFNTWTQQIQEEMNRPSSADIPLIWRHLIDTIAEYRDENFLGNEKSGEWPSIVDEIDYPVETSLGAGDGWPADYVRPIALYYVKDDAVYDPIDQTTLAEIRRLQDSLTAQGLPNYWTFHASRVHVDRRAPSLYTFKLDYIGQEAVPRYTYDGVEWIFEIDSNYDGIYVPLTGSYGGLMTTGKIGELIKWGAQARFARRLKDDAEYTRAKTFEEAAYQTLRRQVTARRGNLITPPKD